MKAKLLALCLTVGMLVSTGCAASVRYNRGYDRGYYGPAYRYDRDRERHERYRRDHHDDRRDPRYDDRGYDGRR
jgi:hypothetical protein